MSTDFNKIKDLVKKRDVFLAEHPELMALQEEINRILMEAGPNKHNRNVALQSMLLKTWFRITEIGTLPKDTEPDETNKDN